MARTKTHKTSQNVKYTKRQHTLRYNYFLFFWFLFLMFNNFSKQMLIYRLDTVNEKHWVFKPVLGFKF